MKKLILVLCMLCFTTGCVCVQKSSIEQIAHEITSSSVKVYNHNNEGFKYYLPSGMQISYKDEYNEILKSDGYTFYLYVDLIKYFNKVEIEMEENEIIYDSYVFEKDNIKGIINVYEEDNNEYLVSVIYNYATIEARVRRQDIKSTITKCLLVTTSIKYNKNVITNMLGKDITTAEEEINVFKIKDDGSVYLQVDDTYHEDHSFDSEIIR